MDYPKYQYSIFLDGRDEQLVIRADTWDEFLKLKKNANQIIAKKTPKSEDTELTTMCEKHDIAMSQATSKKTGKPYWYHRKDGKMCFGKGYLD